MRIHSFTKALAVAGAIALSGCEQHDETPLAPATVETTEDEGGSGAETIAPSNPFFGEWTVNAAKIAPWWDGKGEEPAADPAFASNVVLGSNKSGGPVLLNCDKPNYEVNMTSPRGLFEGNLPDPGKDASDLGFKSSEITALRFTCASGGSDVSLDFAMIDDDTIMLGLDNVLYTLKRVYR